MSYDIHIVDRKTKKIIDLLDFPEFDGQPFEDYGGTYCIGGRTDLVTNITYNYAPFFIKLFGKNGIRSLYNKPLGESETILHNAIVTIENGLKENPDEWVYKYPDNDTEQPTGYWACTIENTKKALERLLFLIDYAKKIDNNYSTNFEFQGD